MVERKSKSRAAAGKCNVRDCTEEAYRSLFTKKVTDALPELKLVSEDERRAHLCKKHYREFKRATRDERKLEQLGRD